jgi:hypothetical protein
MLQLESGPPIKLLLLHPLSECDLHHHAEHNNNHRIIIMHALPVAGLVCRSCSFLRILAKENSWKQ